MFQYLLRLRDSCAPNLNPHPRRVHTNSDESATATSLRQSTDTRPVAGYQGLLLGPAPALQLSFRGNRVRDLIEALRPHKLNGSARKCIGRMRARLMLGDAFG